MSQDNVEIVRRMYDAYKRGDFDSALAHFDPASNGLSHGDDKVLLAAWQTGRAKASGVDVSEENFCVFTVQEGKIVRQEMFRHRSEALKAAGLAE